MLIVASWIMIMMMLMINAVKGLEVGVGGVMTFVVACKQRWCTCVDNEHVWKLWGQWGGGVGGNDVRCCLQTKMMFLCGWWTCLEAVGGGSGGVGGVMMFVVACKTLANKDVFGRGWGGGASAICGKYATGNCHEERRILQSFDASICAFLVVALWKHRSCWFVPVCCPMLCQAASVEKKGCAKAFRRLGNLLFLVLLWGKYQKESCKLMSH